MKTSLPSTPSSKRYVGVLSLAMITYFNVCGGPFGSEPIIAAAGPFIGIVATIAFPLLWCLPLSLLFAELFTAFPCDGSHVSWVGLAFGKSSGFQVGYWSWTSGVIDNAIYPCIVVDSLQAVLDPSQDFSLPMQLILRAIVATVFMLPCLFDIQVVGRSLLVVGMLMAGPCLALIFYSLPLIEPSNWFIVPASIDWSSLLSYLYWNYSGFDSAGSCAGEIADPRSTYPKAMVLTTLLIALTYVLPFLAVAGVNRPDFSTWTDGSFTSIAKEIGGPTLGSGMLMSIILGNLGLYIAEMTKDAFQLAGMADLGLAPGIFAKRDAASGVPRTSVLVSYGLIVLMSMFNFQVILSIDNFFSALTSVFEIMAAVRLRFKHPDVKRPYEFPVSNSKLVLLMIFPVAFGLLIMWNEFNKSWATVTLNTLAMAFGYFYHHRYVRHFRSYAYHQIDSQQL